MRQGNTTSRIGPGKYETLKSTMSKKGVYHQTDKRRDPFEPSDDGNN
jgi:hypothetical protein